MIEQGFAQVFVLFMIITGFILGVSLTLVGGSRFIRRRPIFLNPNSGIAHLITDEYMFTIYGIKNRATNLALFVFGCGITAMSIWILVVVVPNISAVGA